MATIRNISTLKGWATISKQKIKQASFSKFGIVKKNDFKIFLKENYDYRASKNRLKDASVVYHRENFPLMRHTLLAYEGKTFYHTRMYSNLTKNFYPVNNW